MNLLLASLLNYCPTSLGIPVRRHTGERGSSLRLKKAATEPWTFKGQCLLGWHLAPKTLTPSGDSSILVMSVREPGTTC